MINNENLAVFTTKPIMEIRTEILVVLHDKDGDWQFLSHDDIRENDAAIVSIKQMLEIDSTIKEVLNLELGQMAVRTSKNDPWITKDI